MVVKRIVNDYRGMIYEKFKIDVQIETQVLRILEKAQGKEESKMFKQPEQRTRAAKKFFIKNNSSVRICSILKLLN